MYCTCVCLLALMILTNYPLPTKDKINFIDEQYMTGFPHFILILGKSTHIGKYCKFLFLRENIIPQFWCFASILKNIKEYKIASTNFFI